MSTIGIGRLGGPLQTPSTGGSTRVATIAKHAVIGGAIGAAGAAALSFTALPFIGALSAPIAAAIGGAAGLVIGGVVGFLRSRGAVDGVKGGAAHLPQMAPPAPSVGTGGLPPALPART